MFPAIQLCLLLSLLVLVHAPTGYSMLTKYVLNYFCIKTMRYSFLLRRDKYKCNANVRCKDNKITKIHHFVA